MPSLEINSFVYRVCRHYDYLNALNRDELKFITRLVDAVLSNQSTTPSEPDQPRMVEISRFLVSQRAPRRTYKQGFKRFNAQEPKETTGSDRSRFEVIKMKVSSFLFTIIQRIRTLWHAITHWFETSDLWLLEFKLQKTIQFSQVHSRFENERHPLHTDDLSQARIILMGEEHTKPEHKRMERAIINTYGSNGDFILTEGGFFETRRFYQTMKFLYLTQFSHQFNLDTWDHEEGFEKTLSLLREMQLCLRTKKPITLDWARSYLSATEQRNISLYQKINALLVQHPDKKIFVIAGSAHLTPGVLKPYEIRDKIQAAEDLKASVVIFSDNFDSNTDDYYGDLTGVPTI